ncbi:hypothetical protein [Hymenobacter sp. B1770]|uniref:hypothetical protein n=1 Tax=Hymenobacter sp. B1770 TaxID=1718788 RepID=UPI003CE8D428
MEQRIELVITRPGRMLLVWFGGLAVCISVAIAGVIAVERLGENAVIVWLVLIIGGSLFGLYWLGKRNGAKPVLLTLWEDKLLVQDLTTGRERDVHYDNIVSYQHSEFDGVELLRIKLKDGSKERIGINDMHKHQTLSPLLKEFEAALAIHQRASNGAAKVVREKTFFEKSISTVLLVMLSGLMAWVTWMIFTSDKPLGADILGCYASFIAYAMAWCNARVQRAT